MSSLPPSGRRDRHSADSLTATEGEVDSLLPDGFDVTEWTRAACENSGVPFAVADPVTLRKLTKLIRHPT